MGALVFYDNTQIGDKVQNLRNQANLTSQELAEEIGIESSLLNRIETGQRNIGAGEVLILADFFKVSPDYFIREVKASFLLRDEGQKVLFQSALDEFEKDIETFLALEAVATE